MENRSSAPPNPPTGLEDDAGGAVGASNGEAGTALVHPPKSSSVATVGARFFDAGGDVTGADQSRPTSFAVKVSGTFIIEVAVVDDVGGAGSGGSSGTFHALPPHSSMLGGSILATVEVVVETLGFGSGSGGSGLDMLKAAFKSFSGLDQLGARGAGGGIGGRGSSIPNGSLGTDAGCGVGGRGSSSPNGSLETDGGGGAAVGVAEAKPVKSESNPFDEVDGARACGAGRDDGLAGGGDAILSKMLPPLTEELREVT